MARHRTDYLYRSYLLNNKQELFKQVNNALFYDYANYQLQENGVVINDPFRVLENPKNLETILIENDYSYDIFEIVKILGANKKRKSRLRDKIVSIYNDSLLVGYTCYFITFDFSDNFISKTSETTRRRYVQRFMKEHCRHYVANIDYGVDDKYTNREHYHAFVSSNNYGNMIHDWHTMTNSGINIKKLRIYKNMNKTYRKLSLYISKLTNHAVKTSVKRNVYIYDRNKDFAKS